MVKRLIGAALAGLVLGAVFVPVTAQVALAAEAGAEEGAAEVEQLPSIDEVGTDVAREEGFFPEEYVSPAWFKWVLYPAIVLGVIITLSLLFYYLAKQPSFAEERERSKKR